MGIQVLVVDHHPLLRLGVKQALVGEIADCGVSQADNAADAMHAVWNGNWSLVVMDVSLPGRCGLELLKEIKAARPKLPVLVLSSQPEFATRTLRCGASGYVTKDSPPEALLQAVRQVVSGGKYISATIAERLASEFSVDAEKPLHQQLSDREYDVLIRIASGQSVGQIAAALNLSVKTVSTYRTRILAKMCLKNNAELTKYAIRNQLVL